MSPKDLKRFLKADVISSMQRNKLFCIFKKAKELGLIIDALGGGALTNSQLIAFLKAVGDKNRSGMIKSDLVNAVNEELDQYFG